MGRSVAFSGLAAVAVAGILAVPAAAVPKGTKGVLEVEYLLSGKASQKIGATDSVEWRVTRSLSYRVELRAAELATKAPVMPLAPLAASSPAGRVAATAQKHQGALTQMQDEIARCKGDQACQMRVSMQFMSSGSGAAMMDDMMKTAQSAASERPRYQHWAGVDAAGKPLAASGRYRVDEYRKVVVYDPICGRTGNYCTDERQTKGEGSLSFSTVFEKELASGGVTVDDQLGLLTVAFPTPYGFAVDATESGQTTQTGPFSRRRNLRVLERYQKSAEQKFGAADFKVTMPLREARGETTLPVSKGLNGADGTLTIRWRFALAP